MCRVQVLILSHAENAMVDNHVIIKLVITYVTETAKMNQMDTQNFTTILNFITSYLMIC